jgi:hypothetical protein
MEHNREMRIAKSRTLAAFGGDEMSAPGQLVQDAETISFGFLSAKTSDALAHALETDAVTPEHVEILEKAASFLRDISDGARFTMSGTFRPGAVPARSIAALDIAFGPIQSLRKLVAQRNDLAAFFDELAQAVIEVKNTGHAHQVEVPVRAAQSFFEGLNDWLNLELRSRRPTLGRRRGRTF